MAGCNIRFQNGDFIIKVVGARRQGFVIFADSLGKLGCLEEGVGGGFLIMRLGKKCLGGKKRALAMAHHPWNTVKEACGDLSGLRPLLRVQIG